MSYLIDGGSHIDAPLSNLAIRAFNAGGDFIAEMLMPRVPVGKQSDYYYIINLANHMRVPDTRRAPKVAAKFGEWDTSSAQYFADNYAFGTDYALETLTNADNAVRVRDTSQRFVVDSLRRGREQRVRNLVTSISNVGSGVSLTGANKWSDAVGSDPIADVNSGHAFIENRTGMHANTMAIDKDTYRMLRQHPVVRDYAKWTMAGPVPDAMLAELFEVSRIAVARGVYNSAKEGAAASLQNIWGNNCLLAYVEAAPAGTQVATFGLTFNWQPDEFPLPFVVERYRHFNPSVKAECMEAQYFADEIIVARDLSYLITATL